MRGEGRGLFCKKVPFLPPAPPIHPAKNLTLEDDRLTFPGRPSLDRWSPGNAMKHFPPGTLCVSHHTACRFAEKNAVFPLGLDRAALCCRLAFYLFKAKTLLLLQTRDIYRHAAGGPAVEGRDRASRRLAGLPGRVFEGKRGRGGKGELFAKSSPFPPQKTFRQKSRPKRHAQQRSGRRCVR